MYDYFSSSQLPSLVDIRFKPCSNSSSTLAVMESLFKRSQYRSVKGLGHRVLALWHFQQFIVTSYTKLERSALKHLNFACILVSPHVSHLSKHKTTTHGFPNTPSGGGAGASSGTIRLHRTIPPGRDSVAMRQSGSTVGSGVGMNSVGSHGKETTHRISYVTYSNAWNHPTCNVSEDCSYVMCSFARGLSRMGSHIYTPMRSGPLVE